MTARPGETRRGRLRLVLLALIFALPVVLALALYLAEWRPESTANRGELVVPPRPLRDATLINLDNEPLAFSSLFGKWLLVYIGPAACDADCERSLYTMRQVRAAQGEQAARVQRVYVVTDPAGRDRLRFTLRDYPGMTVLAGPPGSVEMLVAQFRLETIPPDERAGRLYLVDPLGNFMMHFAPQADPAGVRKDLARLLRLSRTG